MLFIWGVAESPKLDFMTLMPRSANVSRIRSKNTKPGMTFRRMLHGLRYEFPPKRSHEKGKKMCTLLDRANPSGKIGDYAVRDGSDQRPCVSEAVVS